MSHEVEDAVRRLAAKEALGQVKETLSQVADPQPSAEEEEQVVFAPQWDELARDCRELADRLREVPVLTVLAVLRGGVFPALLLSHELGVPDLRTCRASGYTGRERGALRWFQPPDAGLVASGGANVLVVDDLADSGQTMHSLRYMLPEAICCAPYAKPAGESSLHLYSRRVRQDVWIRFPWETE